MAEAIERVGAFAAAVSAEHEADDFGTPIHRSSPGIAAIEIVAGRDASANFDMQSLATLMHGDRIVLRRSEHHVQFLHPKGWTYFDTLRQKLHWNEGVA